MIRNLLVLSAATVFVADAIAGKVRVVANTGAPYVRVQDAIIDARKGDVVLVKSSAQTSMRISDKGLAVVADNGVSLQVTGGVRVSNLKSDTLVVLSGIHSQGVYESNLADIGHGLLAQDNLGQILVQDCSFSALNNAGATCIDPPHGAFVRNSDGIAFTRSTLTGASVAWVFTATSYPGEQGFGLNAVHSTVSFDSVGVLGGSGGATCNSGYPDGAGGGHGVSLLNAVLFASGSTCQGGHGSNSQTGPPLGLCLPGGLGGSGGHGIQVQTSTARLLSTTTNGSLAGTGCGSMMGGSPGLPVSGVATLLPGADRRLNGPRIVRDVQLAVFSFSGAPGETVEIAAALDQAVHTVDVGQKGVLHVPTPRWRSVGVVPASGTLIRSYKLPNLPPTDPGAIFVVQARFINPSSGQAQLSNPHVLVEVDATY